MLFSEGVGDMIVGRLKLPPAVAALAPRSRPLPITIRARWAGIAGFTTSATRCIIFHGVILVRFGRITRIRFDRVVVLKSPLALRFVAAGLFHLR
jgi:hypothetical protein